MKWIFLNAIICLGLTLYLIIRKRNLGSPLLKLGYSINWFAIVLIPMYLSILIPMVFDLKFVLEERNYIQSSDISISYITNIANFLLMLLVFGLISFQRKVIFEKGLIGPAARIILWKKIESISWLKREKVYLLTLKHKARFFGTGTVIETEWEVPLEKKEIIDRIFEKYLQVLMEEGPNGR